MYKLEVKVIDDVNNACADTHMALILFCNREYFGL